MKTIFKSVTLILASLLPLSLGAQTTIRGTVVDSLSREAEVGAVIQFFKSGDEKPAAYSVTDSLGHFERTMSGQGDFVLLLQNMGRKTVRRGFTLDGQADLDLGEILLQDDASAIDAATVQSMRTLVKLDVNKLTYNVEADPDSKSGTVLDMLRKVPMVTVDGQDKITVNGSSDFKVYVDGKPNQMLSANPSQIFKVMPASAIKDIEVITNPGARFDAEGAGGVLNLITGAASGGGAAVSDGLYGSATIGATTKGAVNESLFLSAKKDKFTVGLNAALANQKLKGITYDSFQKNLSDGVTLSNHIGMDQKSPIVYADLNASYEIDSRNLLSGSFGLTGLKQHMVGSSVIGSDGSYPYSYTSEITSEYGTSQINGSVDFQHNSADVPGRAMTLSYRYSGTPVSSDYINRQGEFSGAVPMIPDNRTVGDDNSIENTFQLDYTTPVGKGQSLSSGLKYIRRHNSADDKYYTGGDPWVFDRGTSMLYDHFNSIGAAYSEYTGTFGKMTLIAGLRYEMTWQKVEYGEGYGHDFDSRFGDLVPSASLQYSISAMQNIGITFNRRIQRPGITYLNPYVDRSSMTYISYGNSDLTSARNDIVSLVYNFYNPKWVVSLTGRYSHCGSGISQYSFYKDGILNTTYGNIVNENNTGLTAFINWTASPKTRIYTNSSFGYGAFSSDELGMSNSGWNWTCLIGLQQTLPASIMLSANLTSTGRTWNLQGWSDGMSMAVIGLSKGFLSDKLRLTAQFASNLGTGDLEMESLAAGKGYETRSIVSVPIRQAGIGLTYTFGKPGFQVKKARKTINNDDVINNSNGQGPGGSTPLTNQTGGGTGIGM
jgi:hypothetical protein